MALPLMLRIRCSWCTVRNETNTSVLLSLASEEIVNVKSSKLALFSYSQKERLFVVVFFFCSVSKLWWQEGGQKSIPISIFPLCILDGLIRQVWVHWAASCGVKPIVSITVPQHCLFNYSCADFHAKVQKLDGKSLEEPRSGSRHCCLAVCSQGDKRASKWQFLPR